jgi:hypothetical protein
MTIGSQNDRITVLYGAAARPGRQKRLGRGHPSAARANLLTSVAADAAGYYDGTSVPSPFEALIKPIPGRLVTVRRAQTCS